jgi:hypothetical protein
MRYMLLTYNAPGGDELWAGMTESERQAEEDEYVRLMEKMRQTNAFIAANELDRSPKHARSGSGTARAASATALLSRAKGSSLDTS